MKSELGAGTSVTLYLPRTHRKIAIAATTTTTMSVPQGARILVVEDNPEVAEVAAGLLEQLGNVTRIVGNADAALKALDEDAPDLVFSDIVMAGGMDGLELARRIRAERPDIPILLATGYSQAAERMGDEFPILTKPYQIADLNRALTQLLGSPDAPDAESDLEAERQPAASQSA
jgi:CheY-like chemotaxis protein